MLRCLHIALIAYLFIQLVYATDTTSRLHKIPQYQRLPPLKKQAEIYNGWRKERLEKVPEILQNSGVDAWIVRSPSVYCIFCILTYWPQISQREYAEDTVFWSMKTFEQFSARRRTTSIFFANPKGDGPSSYTWIDNTAEVWTQMREVLTEHDPYSIAVNVDSQIAFSSGLHAGESMLLTQELGSPWKDRLVAVPMIAVEYIATMPKSQLPWYRKMMETAWAMISEAFSESVITPGKTTTEVSGAHMVRTAAVPD